MHFIADTLSPQDLPERLIDTGIPDLHGNPGGKIHVIVPNDEGVVTLALDGVKRFFQRDVVLRQGNGTPFLCEKAHTG